MAAVLMITASGSYKMEYPSSSKTRQGWGGETVWWLRALDAQAKGPEF